MNAFKTYRLFFFLTCIGSFLGCHRASSPGAHREIETDSLIPNPGLEAPAAPYLPLGYLPVGWNKVVIGVPATFTIDTTVKHAGRSSVRMDAADIARSYIQSEPIEVAPGEKIYASAWVKCQDILKTQGTCILIGDFFQADGHGDDARKFDVAKVDKPGWQLVSGSMIVPEGAATMRVRIGFSYTKGTAWFDDVRVRSERQLVARIDKSDTKLSPGGGPISITILNRQHQRGLANVDVVLAKIPAPPKAATKPATKPATTRAATKPAEEEEAKPQEARDAVLKVAAATTRPVAQRKVVPVELNGESTQTIRVPLDFQIRGEAELGMLLWPELPIAPTKASPLFADYRKVNVPHPILLQPTLPTHWVIEEGPPKLEGEFDLALSDKDRDGATLTITVADKAGHSFGQWKSSAPLPDGTTSYAISCPDAPVGEYTLVAEFTPKVGAPIKVERLWHVIPRRLAEVKLNSGGYCVYDGKAIFPIGMFNGSLWKDMQAAGMTVSHAYNAVRVVAHQRADDNRANEFFDESLKHGMKICCLVPLKYAEDGEWDRFRRQIRMFRNHPALLCWDEEEGLARGDWKPETLAMVRKILNEEDPHHPFMVGDSRDVIGHVTDRSNFFPLPYMDLGMWWWYPFPLKDKAAGALEGDEGAKSAEMVLPTFLTQRNTDKPIWVGIQSYKHDKKSPYPTPQEYRAQAYAALCGGAKGLMYYGGGVHGGLQADPEAAHWKDLQGIVHEVVDRADFWMEPQSQSATYAPSSALISTLIKHHNGKTVFVAVNRSVKPVEVTFDLPTLSGQGNVVGESRTMEITDHHLKESFQGLGVHVYELATP